MGDRAKILVNSKQKENSKQVSGKKNKTEINFFFPKKSIGHNKKSVTYNQT